MIQPILSPVQPAVSETRPPTLADIPRGLPAEIALPPDSDDELDEEHMDISHIDLWQVSSNSSITKQRDPEPALNHLFDTNHGFLIAEGNWRAKDSQRKLQWSEVIYQTWKRAEKRANELALQGKGSPPGGPISNLQSVVRHSITNQGTQSVMRAAYAANDWIPGSDGPEEWRRFTETDKYFFFFALMGTENVKGLLWFLRDHAVEMGRKEPATLFVNKSTSFTPSAATNSISGAVRPNLRPALGIKLMRSSARDDSSSATLPS
ncbi:MAG: hypothetical protein L6R36_007780 [Xanthoria steineri]|nr:MAG: hypothetical protein L6R36_007780 [Xanthoria steineri]